MGAKGPSERVREARLHVTNVLRLGNAEVVGSVFKVQSNHVGRLSERLEVESGFHVCAKGFGKLQVGSGEQEIVHHYSEEEKIGFVAAKVQARIVRGLRPAYAREN